MLRSDMMLEPIRTNSRSARNSSIDGKENKTNLNWKQVELNTIAAGFGWLGKVSGDVHR